MHSLILCSVLCLLISACGGGGGDSASGPPPAFTTADLAGMSNIIGVSTGGTNQGIIAGSATLSSTGNVSSGSYIHSVGTAANLTGGSLALTGIGMISGVINTSIGVTSTILYGKLGASKTFGTFVSATSSGEYDLVTVIKSGGSFASADIQGTWHFCEMSSGGTVENIYYGTLVVGSGGAFTTPRSSGTATINSEGLFSGTASLIPSGTATFEGALDASRGLAVYCTLYSNGEHSISIAIKETGTFSSSDLSGTWHFTLASNGVIEGVSYGTIQLDSAGQIRGGYYRSSGVNVSLSGGAVSITSSGVLSGIINASDGMTFTVVYGKMNQSKNVISLIGPSSTGGRDFIIALKEN